MGINIGTVLGTSIIKYTKANTEERPAPHVLERLQLPIGERHWTTDQVPTNSRGETIRGVLFLNTKASKASLADLFSGIEAGNAQTVDVGKVQMFFFTLIVALGYSAVVGASFFDPTTVPFKGFPEFSASMVTLIAVSHAGYLANTAAPHTDTSEP